MVEPRCSVGGNIFEQLGTGAQRPEAELVDYQELVVVLTLQPQQPCLPRPRAARLTRRPPW